MILVPLLKHPGLAFERRMLPGSTESWASIINPDLGFGSGRRGRIRAAQLFQGLNFISDRAYRLRPPGAK
jgi:hypothetical protein